MTRTCTIGLLALLVLTACGRQSASREAETAALRDRVERLERQAAADRERLAADLSALRESLDEANQHLIALSAPGVGPDAAARPAKSPRAALRESLRGVVDMSRQALDRLNQGLDKSLARPQPPEDPAAPGK